MNIRDLLRVYDMSTFDSEYIDKDFVRYMDNDCIIAYQEPEIKSGNRPSWLKVDGKRVLSVCYKFIFKGVRAIRTGFIFVCQSSDGCAINIGRNDNHYINRFSQYYPKDNFFVLNDDLYDKYMMLLAFDKLNE